MDRCLRQSVHVGPRAGVSRFYRGRYARERAGDAGPRLESGGRGSGTADWRLEISDFRIGGRLLGIVVAAATLVLAVGVSAQETRPAAPERMEQAPIEVEDLAPVEKLDTHIPLDLTFQDEDGKVVRLGDYFTGKRPVILNLGYYRCPMLCGLILNGLTDAMKDITWTPGQEFEVVSVSFDHRETPPLARLKKQNYMREYGRPSAAAGWHFLVGKEPQIQALCEAVGYKFRWDDRQNQYAHPSVLVILTPDGRISRYLYGIQFVPQTVRLSLVEASEGKIGSTVDRVLLYCFHYDADEGRYSLAARRLMSLAAAMTILAMGVWLVPRWFRGPPPPPTDVEDAREAHRE